MKDLRTNARNAEKDYMTNLHIIQWARTAKDGAKIVIASLNGPARVLTISTHKEKPVAMIYDEASNFEFKSASHPKDPDTKV